MPAALLSVLVFFLVSITSVHAATTVTTFTPGPSSVGRYQKYEATFTISRTFPGLPPSDNPTDTAGFMPYYPYDQAAEGITINAHITAPSGRQIIQPAFYYQKYTGTGRNLTPANEFSWKIRFAPEETGNYTYYITILDKNGSSQYPASATLSFTSVASSSKGFVRISKRDPRFMEFDNGESFIPIGSGHQWWRDADRADDYVTTFSTFGANGINLVRIWDQSDGFKLTTEGHFDAYAYPNDYKPTDTGQINTIKLGTQMNQRGNYEEDRIIEAAEKNGVYLQLCSHGDAYWIWDGSVYSPPDGANLSFTDPKHVNYWKRNFRYRVARWGYSTSVLAWEVWNEHGHIPINSDEYNFYQTYGSYQQQTDPYKHLRTTSQGSQAWSPGLWGSAAMDLANYHDYMMSSRYGTGLYNDEVNFVYNFAQCLRAANSASVSGCHMGDGSSWLGNKPVIWGELDTGTTVWNEPNPQPRADHNVIWAGLFSPIGTVSLDWYWESKNYLPQKYAWAKIASDFFKGIDYAGEKFTYLSTSDVRVTSELINAAGVRVLAMRNSSGNKAYAWVHNRNYIWGNGTSETVSAVSGNFTIGGMAAGNYAVEFWNTHNGTKTSGGTVTASSGNVTINVSNVVNDVAVKIESANISNPTSTPSPVPTGTAKLGDYNHDGDVDYTDYVLLYSTFSQSSSTYNLVGSSTIDIFDINKFLSLYSPY